MDLNEATAAVNNPETHLTVLHSLRKHKNAEIRTAVAKHPNTVDVTLRQMIHDKDKNVLLAVHQNNHAHKLHRHIAGINYHNAVAAEQVQAS
jgi:hypothetical protein